MSAFVQDLTYALRQMKNAPFFALTAVLTLALGIGINAAMFSVVDQVLLRSMPFPQADAVVQMAVSNESGNFNATSLPDIRDWQARSHSFQKIGYYTMLFPTLGGTADPKLVAQIVSSPNLFEMLQAQPMLGRTFVDDDGKVERANVVVLNAGVWQNTYHSDPKIIGRTIPINGLPYTVIGVMPRGFSFPVNTGDNSIWTPLPDDGKSMQDRNSGSLSVIGRLRDGVTVENATHELNTIHDELKREYPGEDTNPVLVESYPRVVTDTVRGGIIALDIAVFAVWLIACANVAGLLLARGSGRQREVALRLALGAQRGRLVRQFLTESLVLSLLGGLLGLGLAFFALHLLKDYLAGAVIFGDQIHIDLKVCLYLLLASCASAILFGLVPALHSAGAPLQEGLRQGSTASGTNRTQSRWRDALVVAEIALTLSLLVAAGLMVRALVTLRHTRIGFVADQVTTGEIYLPSRVGFFTTGSQRESGPALIRSFYMPLLNRLQSMPGVQAVGLTTVRPLQANWDFNMTVELYGHAKPEHNAKSYAQARATSADYFKAMGISLLQGRVFNQGDSPTAPPVAIVNRTFVKRFLNDQNPLGQQVRLNDTGARQWSTIVGVVNDSPQKTIGQPPLPEIHYNLDQLLPEDDLYYVLGSFMMNVAVRSPVASQTISSELRRTVHDLQPEAALNGVRSMQQVIDDSLGNQVLAARLLGLFAVAGLAIAVAGIYGLLTYSVSQRIREMGIRFALGAQRDAVLWLVLRHALLLLAIGVALGAILTAASIKLLSSFLPYTPTAYDGLGAAAVALLLVACGLLTSYLPARRASRIDPVVALRTE